jgi:hypothetical protein
VPAPTTTVAVVKTPHLAKYEGGEGAYGEEEAGVEAEEKEAPPALTPWAAAKKQGGLSA